MDSLPRKIGFFLLFLYLLFCFTFYCPSKGTRSVRTSYRSRFIHRRHHGLRQLFRTAVKDWPEIILRNEAELKKAVSSPENEAIKVEAGQKEFEKSAASDLPPMDAAVNDLTQPQMPTFDEFQAMVSDENQQKKRQADSTLREPSYVIGKNGQAGPIFAKDAPSHHTSSEPNSSGSSGHSSSSNTASSPIQSSLTHNDTVSSLEKPSSAEDPVTTDAVSSEGRVDGGVTTTASTLTDSVILPSSVVESSTGSKEASTSPIQKQQTSIGAVKPTLRVMRNIAAVECGAKLLKASPSARHAASILVDNNDMYMNQPCASEKWFILETCEPVQLDTIQIANYELFSSRFKTFKVYVSDRFPAKEWELLGTFQAYDVKGLQSFDLKGSSDRLIKYVKFEMLDHYGSEHFCPITMVRLFGLVSDDLDDAAAEAEGGVGRVPDAVPSIAPAEPRHDQLKEPDSVEKPTSEKKPEVDLKSPQNSVTVPQDTSSGAATILDSSPPPVQPSKDVPVTDPNPAAASPKHCVGSAQNSVKSPDVKYRPVKRLPPNKRTEARKKYPRTAASDASATQGRTSGLEPALGFLQKATSFILNVLRSAVGSLPDSSSADSRSSSGVALRGLVQPKSSSLANFTFRNDDFYTVIYLFTAICPSLGSRQYASAADCLNCPHPPLNPPHQHLDRGLEHLALCIRALDHQLQPNTLLPFRLSSPHRAWAPCASSVYLLNLTTSSLQLVADPGSSTTLCLPCLLSAYRNITRTFAQWSSISAPLGHTYLRRLIRHHRSSLPAKFQHSDGLPAFPLFASGRTEKLNSATVSLSTPPRNDAALNSASRPTSTSPPPQPQSEEEEVVNMPSVSSSPQLPSTGTPSPTEEFVLPAAIGGSRKETAYMRLNNKVRQIEANVSVSMRYLQELSQSYKRQTEKLSRSFNLTTAWLQATAKGAEERDMQQQLRIDALEQRLSRLLDVLTEQGLIVVSTHVPKTNNTDSILEIRSKVSDMDQQKAGSFSENSDSLTGQISTFIWTAFFPPPDSDVIVLHPPTPAPAFALLPHPLLGETGSETETDSDLCAETNQKGDQTHPHRPQQPQCPVLSANGFCVDMSSSVCPVVLNMTGLPYLPKRKILSWQRQNRLRKDKRNLDWPRYLRFLLNHRWDFGALVSNLYSFCAQANGRLNTGFSWLLGVSHLNATELTFTVTIHLLMASLAQLIVFRLFSRRILSEIFRQQQPILRPQSDQCVARPSAYQSINSAAVQTELNTDAFFERLSEAHLKGAYFPIADSKCSSCTPSLISTSLDNGSLVESQSSASASATGSILALQRTDASSHSNENFTLLQPSPYELPPNFNEDQAHHQSSVLAKTDDRLDPMRDLTSTDSFICSSTGSEVSVTPTHPLSSKLSPDPSVFGPALQPQRKRRLRRLKCKMRRQLSLLP